MSNRERLGTGTVASLPTRLLKSITLAACLVFSVATPSWARTPTADEFFDFAEQLLPLLFPSHGSTSSASPYLYRYYPATQNYLGTAGNDIYLFGPVTGNTLQKVATLSGVACAVLPTDCTLIQVKAFLASVDASTATGLPTTGNMAMENYDLCYLNNGNDYASEKAGIDSDIAGFSRANAYRIGTRRTNAQVVDERAGTNAGGSIRTEIDIQYDLEYGDGTKGPEYRATLISGSSAGSCSTPQTGSQLRFFGNHRAVNVSVESSNSRGNLYLLATGAPAATPVVYRRSIDFSVNDPQKKATYAIVTGPGPSATINGVAEAFSLKLLSPRVTRDDPLLSGKPGNILNASDTRDFQICRSATSPLPPAKVANCAGYGAGGNSIALNFDPATQTASAIDANFAKLGFVANGTYTFALYNDDGWKTVNGHQNKTPIATYTATLKTLPYTFTELAGSGVASDNYPGIVSNSLTPVQIAGLLTSGSASSMNWTWKTPGSPADRQVFRLGAITESSQGLVTGSTSTTGYPVNSYGRSFYPGAQATSYSGMPVTAKSADIKSKSSGNYTLQYTNRNGANIVSVIQFN